MELTILNSIKKLLGIEPEYTHFDMDVTIHINSALRRLTQLGVGPTEGFRIDNATEWANYIGDAIDMEWVKDYIYLKTRLIFDPPQTGFLVDAIKSQIAELEWCINSQAETQS